MGDQRNGQTISIIAKPLREQIYEYLRDEMGRGNLLPGSLVNVNEISQRLGISKTPLRDALIQLECDGFVSILPRRGVRINKLSLEDVKHAWEICRALESEILVPVFDKLNEACLLEMERLTREMKRATEMKDTYGFYQNNVAFHNIFLDLSSNSQMRRIIQLNKQRLYDFLNRKHIPQWEAEHCEEHRAFIELIRSGDAQGAAHFLKTTHWSLDDQESYIRQFYFNGDTLE
ncbi:GntR family transcriptional regulator [Desulfoluna sp.]|uniref:GntR family transcriptional regulator n=1 Tax=Desulfoluna sp. TaxID=2045199 RepID=UPI002624423C|nr:GntR family transcriptional regulator [Desulfoluna sp.]